MFHPAVVPPKTTLAQAIDLENYHITCFRHWALRFRPFDPGLGLILDMQASEMENHRAELLHHASRCPVPTTPSPATVKHPATPGPAHFFIINAEAAVAVLNKAVQLKKDARRFYRFCLSDASNESTTTRLYQNLGTLKEAHLKILLESMDHFKSQKTRFSVLKAG